MIYITPTNLVLCERWVTLTAPSSCFEQIPPLGSDKDKHQQFIASHSPGHLPRSDLPVWMYHPDFLYPLPQFF